MDFLDALNQCLPNGEEFKLLSLQSNPIEIDSLITKPKGNKQSKSSKTIKIQHFFALAHKHKFVFALEVYVYISLDNFDETCHNYRYGERLLFVSKADTNGYADTKFSIKDVTEQLLIFLLSIDPNYYLKKVKPLQRKYSKFDRQSYIIGNDLKIPDALRRLSLRVSNGSDEFSKDKYYLHLNFDGNFVDKISLFTRPADHYLFAGSGSNSRKHTLNGTQLLKWWLIIIDNIINNHFKKDSSTIAKLKIPGEDDFRIQKHFSTCTFPNWEAGDIFSDSSERLAAFHVPLFPDDPKSRFLHQLVEENRILNTSLNQFWLELQERQEFKLNVLVSVIGVKGYVASTYRESKSISKLILETKSMKEFSFIKNYITAEEYDTEEGALESYENIVDHLHQSRNSVLISLKGLKTFQPSRVKDCRSIKVLQVHTLKPRKKQKTVDN